jgi:hypothetical protein
MCLWDKVEQSVGFETNSNYIISGLLRQGGIIGG